MLCRHVHFCKEFLSTKQYTRASMKKIMDTDFKDKHDMQMGNMKPPAPKRRKLKETGNRHGVVTEVPKDLHEVIMEALALRKRLETCPNDMDCKEKLDALESRRIPIKTNYYKAAKELPRHWKYDPDTASTLKALPVIPYQSDEDECLSPPFDPMDPNRELPDIDDVPLKDEEEKKTLLKFEEYAKKTRALSYLIFPLSGKEKKRVPIDHPIVGLIGNFAIASFNKAFKIFVKKEELERIHGNKFVDCTYIKMTSKYYIYTKIEATEKDNLGVYEAKVVCTRAKGLRTLTKFVLTNCAPEGKGELAKPIQMNSISDGCSDPEDDSSEDAEDFDPLADPYNGMRRRPKGATCRGYDYYYPYGFGMESF